MPPEILLRFWTGQHLSRRDSNMNAPAIKVPEFEASAPPKKTKAAIKGRFLAPATAELSVAPMAWARASSVTRVLTGT